MTPPCLNCHGRPETPPDLSDYSSLYPAPLLTKSPANLPDPLPQCSAKSQWPEWLQESRTKLQSVPWWVRSNFETTRLTVARAADRPDSPLRVNLGEAELKTSLKFVPGTHAIKSPWADLVIRPGASVDGLLHVQDNALILRGIENGQPGPLDLFTINGIFIDGPASFNGSPTKVTIGDWGELHVLAQTTEAFRFTLDPYMVPRPAPGHDFPTDQQMDQLGGGWISTPVVYRNPQNDVETDFVLTDKIPAALLEPDGRFPETLNVEVLIGRLLSFMSKRPKDTAPSTFKLQDMLKFIDPSSKIEISLSKIQDLFLPGVLDLAPSSLKVEVGLTADRKIELRTPDLNLALDPMDYPARPDYTRPPIHLLSGTVQSGPKTTTVQNRVLEPGLHAIYDPATGLIDVTANLSLQFDLELPGLGNVTVWGHLLLETELIKTDEGIQLLPETTTLKINKLTVVKNDLPGTILADLNLSFSDDPRSIDQITYFSEQKYGHGLGVLQVSGQAGEGWLDLDAQVPIPKDSEGRYDFSRIFEEHPLKLHSFYGIGKGSYETSLKLSAMKPESYGWDPSDTAFIAEFDVDRHQNNKKEPIVKAGEFFIKKSKKGSYGDEWLAALGAALLKVGPVELKDLATELQIDRASYGDQVSEIRVPKFSFSANPKGASTGPLRGPLSIELIPGKRGGLDILWDGRARRLEVKGLDLALNAQQLDVIPKPLLRLLGPKVAGLGMDGHLEGHFTMHFPEDKKKWSGSGNLLLHGDPQGDIYFLDAGGRQVGPAILRDTRWRFRRVDRINWSRQYALGDFHLDTIFNVESLLANQPSRSSPTDIPMFGARGQELKPYEINGVMPYDNMPWSGQGFKNRIVDYVLTLCRQDPDCLAAMKGEAP